MDGTPSDSKQDSSNSRKPIIRKSNSNRSKKSNFSADEISQVKKPKKKKIKENLLRIERESSLRKEKENKIIKKRDSIPPPKMVRTEEEKKAYLSLLKQQIYDINKVFLENREYRRSSQYLPTDIIKNEIRHLQMTEINLKFQYLRMEDKYSQLLRQYENCVTMLKGVHDVSMNREEYKHLAGLISVKKNELLTQKSYINELQKGDWHSIVPKVLDENQKTEEELDYVAHCVQQQSEKYHNVTSHLLKSRRILEEKKENYQKIKKSNKAFSAKSQVTQRNLRNVQETYATKKKEAMELKVTVDCINEVIQDVKEEQRLQFENLTLEEQKIMLIKKETIKARRKHRNKEINNLKEEYHILSKRYKIMQKKLVNMEVSLKDVKYCNKFSVPLNDMEEFNLENNDVLQHIKEIKKEIKYEVAKRIELQSILEDMVGRNVVIYRIRPHKEEHFMKLLTGNILDCGTNQFNFDIIYGEQSNIDDIFQHVYGLYARFIQGFNCCIISIGGHRCGKSYTMFGPNEDGVIFKGLEAIREYEEETKKQLLQTKFLIAGVEMIDNKIYDLIKKETNDNMDVKLDYFKHTIFTHVHYQEAANVDELTNITKHIIFNRQDAATNLSCTKGESTCVIMMKCHVYNKFKHRYYTGKFTHIKLGDITQMVEFPKALNNISHTTGMSHNTKLNYFLSDAFGGSAKTDVIACLSPNTKREQESLTTINLADKMSRVFNNVSQCSDSEKIFHLKYNIERLMRGLKEEYF